MRRSLFSTLTAGLIATVGALTIGVHPAVAESTIDIGSTVIDGAYIKGSGSDYNDGYYTNVCVVIMYSRDNHFYSNASQSCRTNRGSNTWSAPPVPISKYVGPCTFFYTRITGYTNGVNVANKNSSKVEVC